MDVTAQSLLVEGVQTGVYPVLHSLFLKKVKCLHPLHHIEYEIIHIHISKLY